jgi:hypothetical protein
MRAASVYRRDGAILVTSLSMTTVGYFVESPPQLRLDAGASPRQLGETVVTALAASRAGVRPLARNDRSWPLLTVAGVRSARAFYAGTVKVEVEQVEAGVTLRPQDNLGPREGFVDLSEVRLDSSVLDDPAELGRHVLAGLDQAR